MTLREAIAFAMWNSGNPAHLRDSIRVDSLGAIVTPIGGGWTAHQDMALDWGLNRDSYLELADIALATIAEHKE